MKVKIVIRLVTQSFKNIKIGTSVCFVSEKRINGENRMARSDQNQGCAPENDLYFGNGTFPRREFFFGEAPGVLVICPFDKNRNSIPTK